MNILLQTEFEAVDSSIIGGFFFMLKKIGYVATYRNKWAFYAPVEQLRRCIFSPEMSTQQTEAT